MDRRHVIKSLPVVGGLTVAGCSSIPDIGEAGTVLGKVEVINSSYVANDIRVIVERGGATLVERDFSLASLDAEERPGWTMIAPSWSQTQAQYTVRSAHIDDTGAPETTYREYTLSREDYNTYYEDREEDPGCIGAEVRIGSLSDGANAQISVHPTYMEDPCEISDSQ